MGDPTAGIHVSDIADPPWLDHRTTMVEGLRHQVYLMVVEAGRGLAVEQGGKNWWLGEMAAAYNWHTPLGCAL